MSKVYEFKFGMFGTDFNFDKLIKDIHRSYKIPTTDTRKKHNKRILEKFTKVYNDMLEKSKSGWTDQEAISWFHTECLSDYELFCIVYIRLDNNLPMFAAPWQSEAATMIEEYEIVSGLMSRKIGKSSFMTSYIPYRMINNAPEHVIIFAPTAKQLMVMDDLYRAIKTSQFLKDEWVVLHGPLDKKGKLGKEEIIFARDWGYGSCWSDVEALNLSQNTDGETKRGQKGTFFLVDEQQMVKDGILTTVINPMMSDAYSEKKIIKFGTPNTSVNPRADVRWAEEEGDNTVYTINYDWVDGVVEGCLKTSYMMRVFKEHQIPCPFGRRMGICGKRMVDKKARYDEDNDIILLEGAKGYEDAWACDDSCQYFNSFIEEYGAKFGKYTNQTFPDDVMFDVGDVKLRWNISGVSGEKYILSADVGVLQFPTVIGVFRIDSGDVDRLTLVYFKEIPPLSMAKDLSKNDNPSYDPTIEEIKRISKLFNSNGGEILSYYIDATNQLQLAKALVTGKDALPRSKVFQNDTSKNKGVYGVWNSGPYNHMMKAHYQKMLINRRIKAPMLEPFWPKFLREHKEIVVKPTEDGRYIKYAPPRKGGYMGTIDIIDMFSMASLYLLDSTQGKPGRSIVITKGRNVYVAR